MQDAPDDQELDLEQREKPISPEPEPPSDAEEKAVAEEFALAGLTPEQREQKRLSNKPSIDHLPDGVAALDDGSVLPLFDVGERIVAERHTDLLGGAPWLDTRVYIVKSINDETGELLCYDEELQHFAYIGFRNPLTRIKLAPKHGDPFKVPKQQEKQQEDPVAVAGEPAASPVPGDKKKKGRPKGSKNRPKEVIEAEKKAKKAEKAAKKAEKKAKKASKK